MSRKKVLICGSLGFLMSNFIRYLTYRTKEYDIISLDRISNETDIKRLYFNRLHAFHVGDIIDRKYLDRLVILSKPDIIINGVNSDEPTTIVTGTWNLINLGIPIIQVVPHLEAQDEYGWWESSYKMIKNSGNYVLEVPDCFGTWQRTSFGFAKIIKQMCEELNSTFNADKRTWSYSEDISSVIWFMMECVFNNSPLSKHIKAPTIGLLSDYEIAMMLYEINKELKEPKKQDVVENRVLFESSRIPGWSSDTPSFDWALERTIQWYLSNKWALCL